MTADWNMGSFNVGMGIAPTEKLHIYKNIGSPTGILIENPSGSGPASARLSLKGSTSTSYIEHTHPSQGLRYLAGRDNFGLHRFYTLTGSAEVLRMTINNAGLVNIAQKLGVGVNPETPFHVRVNTDLNLRITDGTGKLVMSLLNDAANTFKSFSISGNPLTLNGGSGTGVINFQINSVNVAQFDSSGNLNITSLTASQAVFTDGSKNLVSNAITGTGNVVMSNAPTFTGTVLMAGLQLSDDMAVAKTGSWSMNVDSTQSSEIYLDRGSTSYDAGIRLFTNGSDEWYIGTGYSAISTDFNIRWAGGSPISVFNITSAGVVSIPQLTASLPVFTDGSKNLVSNTVTGSGNVVMSVSPTMTGTVTMQTLEIAATFDIRSNLSTSLVKIWGGAGDGAHLELYGGSHGSRANDFEFGVGGANILLYDASAESIQMLVGNSSTNAISITTLASGNLLILDSNTPKFDFGNAVLNPAYNFLGSGSFSIGGSLTVSTTTFINGNEIFHDDASDFFIKSGGGFNFQSPGGTTILSIDPSDTYAIDLDVDQNAITYLKIDNDTSGTAAGAGVYVDSNGNNGVLLSLSAGYTTSNQYIADSVILEAQSAANLVISNNSNNPISFWINGSEIFKINETIELVDTVYEDINFAIGQLRSGATRPGFVDKRGTGIYQDSFAVGEEVSGSVEIPHASKLSTNMVPHIHWTSDGGDATGNFQFQITYKITLYDGTAWSTSTTVINTGDIAVSQAWDTGRSNFTSNIANLAAVGAQLEVTIERIAAASDEWAGEIFISTWGLHHEKDTMGSRDITTK
jgi:hypothetical protein